MSNGPTLRISHSDERTLVLEILGRLGVPRQQAATQAHWLVEADLRGHPSHGLQRLRVIAERIRRGLAAPAVDPDLEWMSAATLVVDGRRGLGPCVGTAACRALIERAATSGVAVAAVRNANHLGLLAPYVEMCADAGLVGVAATTSEALVHPWGGRHALVGTNPLAIAVPALPEAFVFDMATGAVSMGKILDYRTRRLQLEPGWAIDGDGHPTIDAAAAANGAIAPFGGAKGYGLGLAIELLVAALTGTALGTDVAGTLDTEAICTKGDIFICVNPAVFGIVDVAQRTAAYLRDVRDSTPQEGFKSVLIPGDRARAERRRRLVHGIPVADEVWRDVLALRESLDIEAAAQ